MTILDLFDSIQKSCLPGIWSKAVALTRTGSILVDSADGDEYTLRVHAPGQPVSRKVNLWPGDEDWFCDCNSPTPICVHVAAAIITLKNQAKVANPQEGQEGEGGAREGSPAPISVPQTKSAQISYRFTRQNGALSFDRWIVLPGQKQECLTQSLVSWVGGVSSGRITSLPLAATKEDYSVDSALAGTKRGELDRVTLLSLFKALAGCSNISLDGQGVSVSTKPLKIQAQLISEGSGFRLRQKPDSVDSSAPSEYFKNGAALIGGILRGIDLPSLTESEKQILAGEGRFFSKQEAANLLTEILPALEAKFTLENLVQNLPRIVKSPPRIVVKVEKLDSQVAAASDAESTLAVMPLISYPDSGEEIVLPDLAAEKALTRRLQSELQLMPGQLVKFKGESAVDFLGRLKVGGWQLEGSGLKSFSLESTLQPKIGFHGNEMDFSFESFDTAGGGSFGGGGANRSVDFGRVFQAWRENQNYIPLLGGGWAPLPQDWLAKYGERISAWIAVKNSTQKTPAYLLPEVAALCEELQQPCPDHLKNLRNLLNHVDEMKKATLPPDLKANLRPYQQTGVNWLCFLRDAKMGALLSDDMGLGKTLQALCAIRGRTLVVCPTSVLHGWAQQVAQFRPGLRVAVYHGTERKLDPKADILLTTYALLRLDQAVLHEENWDTIILDEAQTIKNPSSQVAKAAHLLRGDFRIALSGTPIENRLEDLWSQFQFLNPGLLGTLEAFQEQFSSSSSTGLGGPSGFQRLREKIKPFLLRRLKRDVAPELPPRTETVLYCELDSEEREVYDALLASSRQEVVAKLEEGSSVFAALELLLRLRQACCHSDLIPSHIKKARSSKVELLIQTLENSIALGHRALVFSQWTSFLDLIEPALKAAQISYSRLDGTTKNRQEIVADFQNTGGPSVMLISLKAGGVGLTLTAADHVFLMDPWWNPAVEDQAADRVHRIGQVNPVLIHRLVAEGTIEDRVLEMQKNKSQIAAAVLEGSSQAASVTREDILALLR